MLPLITMFFSILRHREKANKPEWKYWRRAAGLRGRLESQSGAGQGIKSHRKSPIFKGLEGISMAEDQAGWRVQGQAEMQGKTAAPISPLGIREEGNSHKTSKEKH